MTYDKNVLLSPTLENQIKNMRKDINDLKDEVKNLQKLFGATISTSELNLSEARLSQRINDNSALITKSEDRLSKIVLPDETKYYLEESEINAFRSNSQKLVAMMTDIESMYDALVAYTTQN